MITAFRREAAPIIRHYSLQLQPTDNHAGYGVFTGSGIRLGVAGMGADNARQLTQIFLAEDGRNSNPVGQWLNFGIAGSGAWPVGSMVFADTVLYPATGQSWRLNPGLIKAGQTRALHTATVATLDSPDTDYEYDLVYEMEAAGMLSVLPDRQILQNTQVVKLISDGPGHPLKQLNKAVIDRLISRNAGGILNMVDCLYNQ